MTGPTMCPMWLGLYTVGPQTYIVTVSPGFLWNGSFLRVNVLYTCKGMDESFEYEPRMDTDETRIRTEDEPQRHRDTEKTRMMICIQTRSCSVFSVPLCLCGSN